MTEKGWYPIRIISSPIIFLGQVFQSPKIIGGIFSALNEGLETIKL